MPSKQKNGETREQYNARLNAYMKNRYRQRRDDAVEFLGGRCVDCGTSELLEFDHVNELTKSFHIGKRLASAPWAVLKAELEKVRAAMPVVPRLPHGLPTSQDVRRSCFCLSRLSGRAPDF